MKHMKRCAMLLATVLLWVSFAPGACIADAGAEGLEESGVDLFLGGWLNDEFSMYLRREDDDISCRLTGLVFACFAFEDDEDTLIASNIPYIDGNVELQRVSDEEYFKFR